MLTILNKKKYIILPKQFFYLYIRTGKSAFLNFIYISHFNTTFQNLWYISISRLWCSCWVLILALFKFSIQGFSFCLFWVCFFKMVWGWFHSSLQYSYQHFLPTAEHIDVGVRPQNRLHIPTAWFCLTRLC